MDKLPGVLGVEIKAGDEEFTVRYDPAKVKPEAIVKALHDAGEKDTKLLPS
jgi:copper chaperone CopZ